MEQWTKHPFRLFAGRWVSVVVAVLCILQLTIPSTDALRLSDNERTFGNWTHIADFVFTGGGRLEGNIASTSTSSWLLLFEESLWIDLRMRKDPEVSTCDLKAMASWSVKLEPQSKRIDFWITEFGRYHAFIVDVSASQCTETMVLLRKWRSTKSRGSIRIVHRLFSNRFDHWQNKPKDYQLLTEGPISSGLTTASFDLHFENGPYGRLREFSADEIPILPTLCLFMVLNLFLVRFQLASVRLLWTNTGIAISSILLVMFCAKLASVCITLFGLTFFMFKGKELHGSHDYKWGSLLLDGVFGFGVTLLLVLTSKGWMISTPSVSLTSNKSAVFLMIVLIVHSLANIFSVAEMIFFDATSVTLANDHYGMAVEIFVGCSHFYIFVATYAELVNLMLRSRKHVGAKLRGRVFSVVAALLLTWGIAPVIQVGASHATPYWLEPFAVTIITLSIQLFVSTLFAWALRPEVLWELHGERPHIGAAKLLTGTYRKPIQATRSDDDLMEEMDSLLL